MRAFMFLLIALTLSMIMRADAAGSGSAAVSDIWSILLPLIQGFLVLFWPMVLAWLAVRLSDLLGIQSAAKRQEIETGLRNALHAAALNGLKVAVTRYGLPPTGINAESSHVVTDAIGYVLSKNPQTVKKLGISKNDLRAIVLSKVPDLVSPRGPT